MFNKNFHEETKSHFNKHSTQGDFVEMVNRQNGEVTPGSPTGRERDMLLELEHFGIELMKDEPDREILFQILFNKLRSVPVVREFTLQLDSFSELETQDVSLPVSKSMGQSLGDICDHMVTQLLADPSLVGFFLKAEDLGIYTFLGLKLVDATWKDQEKLLPSLHIKYSVLG